MRAITKLRVRYSKNQDVRMSSHLEVISTIKNCVDKSGLPVCRRGGVNKKMCIAFGPPLPAGYTSRCELFDAEMAQRVEPEAARLAMTANIRPGFEILSVSSIPVFSPPVDTAVNAAGYRIWNLGDIENRDEKIKEFLLKKEYPIERITDKSAHTIDARPLVREIEAAGDGISVLLRFGPKRTIKPDILVQKIFSMDETRKAAMLIERTSFYFEAGDGALRTVY